jgi:hypothetical protein
VAELAQSRQTLAAKGTQLAFVHVGDVEKGQAFFEARGLADVHQFSDPDCSLYRAFGLERRPFWVLFDPSMWWRGYKCVRAGNGFGVPVGDVLRMPGVFLLDKGKVVRTYRHARFDDRPDYLELACPLEST